MKASSESGECASLISTALPVAGFIGIAFRQLSLGYGHYFSAGPTDSAFRSARTFESILGPMKPLQSQSGLQVRHVLWSRRKSRDDTHSAERSVEGGLQVCESPLSRPEDYHTPTRRTILPIPPRS